MFDDTLVEFVAALAEAIAQFDNNTDNCGAVLAPACVTTIVALLPEAVVNVTMPDRADVLVFAEACNVTDALPEPEVGDTCNQD